MSAKTLQEMIDESFQSYARQIKAWEDFAAQCERNSEYYRGLLDEIAKNFPEAFICDDGTPSALSPLRAKLPELVAALVERKHTLEVKNGMV